MKKKKLTFDEIPSALVDIMDRLSTIEELIKGQKAPQQPKASKAPRKPKSTPVKEKSALPSGTLSADMASKLIGKAKITLYNLAKKGKIPARKEGRNWVFLEAELLAWLRDKTPTRKQRVIRKQEVQPSNRRGRKSREAKEIAIIETPVKVVVEKKRRGRPKKNIVVASEPIKRRTGRRPRIIKKSI